MAANKDAIYGDGLQDGTLAVTRNKTIGMAALCFVGIVLQVVQIPGPKEVELLCGVVYLAYNVVGMVLVRVVTVSFKFEDPAMLTYAFRMSACMTTYAVVVMATLPFFKATAALKLMSLAGLVNVIICIPTNIREMFYLNRARAAGVGVGDAKPLSGCATAFVAAFWALGTALVLCMTGVALAILKNKATGGALWELMFLLYCVMNLVPLFLPKILHLVTTETSTHWPKLMIFHFCCVILSVVIMAPAIPLIKKKSMQRMFGIVGVVNGLIVAAAVAGSTALVYYKPRKDQTKSRSASKDGLALGEKDAGFTPDV
jgi:hypothetical protein